MFAGTKLSFSKYAAAKVGTDVLSSGKKLYKESKKLGKAMSSSGAADPSNVASTGEVVNQAHELITIASGMDFDAVKEVLTSDVTHSLVGELTPFIGILMSGYKSAKSWRAVAKNARDLYKADYYLEGVLPGDPTAAAEAVNQCVKRFLAANSAEAIRNSAALGVKVGGLFADFGTATTAAAGAASVAAKLLQELVILGIDYRDMKAGNERLKDPATLDFTVFQDCPVLGCYLISCSDTSMMVNLLVSDMGKVGWQDKVEKMKKTQLDPLIKNASKAIISSHLTLDGLKSNKGIVQTPGFLDRQKANLANNFNKLISSKAKAALN